MKFILFLILCIFIAGCSSNNIEKIKFYKVNRTSTAIKIDGKLNEPAWTSAKSINFKRMPPYKCTEKAHAKILWDDSYIYFAGVFYDSDIVQEANQDGQHHYATGDLMEVFLKPQNKTYYWEVFATPNNKKTSFFRLSRGRIGLPSNNYKMPGLVAASSCTGTLNNPSDYDTLWTVEIAIPIKELEKNGEKITSGKIWRFLLGRYNYSAYLDRKELTMSGNPCGGNFHNFKSWNYLKLVKP